MEFLLESDVELEVLELVPISWARDLSAELASVGIPHVLDADRGAQPLVSTRLVGERHCEVLVPAERLEEAETVRAAVYRREVPLSPDQESDRSGDGDGSAPASKSFLRNVGIALLAASLLAIANRCF